jgi:hypothetical protein
MPQPIPENATSLQQPSAAIRKWLASGAGQGRPTSRGGPFRRRQTLRRLEALAEATAHEVRPQTAVAHVHVLLVPDNPDAIVNQESLEDVSLEARQS